MKTKTFINGFTSWQETHYDIVEFITDHLNAWRGDDAWSTILKRYQEQGRGGMYELAQEWTDIFERDYEGVCWGEELEYYEELDKFLEDKNNER